jgi:4'-phosphopantetheinyl transferase
LRQALSPDELERARRFRSDREQTHFVVARGVLRVILGWYLKIEPSDVRFSYQRYGKPVLESRQGNLGLEFNVSHSDGLGLVAIGNGRRVGIDVERVRTDMVLPIPAGGLPSARYSATPGGPVSSHLGFFKCWTRTEALLKASGDGLSGLDQAKALTALSEGTLARLAAPDATEGWELRDLLPAEGYVGAVAVEGAGYVLRCWQVPLRVIQAFEKRQLN